MSLMNSVLWQPKALRNFPGQANADIRAAVSAELVDLAQARNVTALVRHEYGHRLRVGKYRVFFDFDGAARIVSIEEVKKRDERTV